MQYAKIIDNILVYPSSLEFNGIPGWTSHDTMLRSKGYLPVPNHPEFQRGKTIVFDSFEVVANVSTRIEPRQVIVDGHQEMQNNEIIVDQSYINIIEWHYADDEPAEPESPTVVYYDKYEIKKACEDLNLWNDVKATIEAAGKWDSFLLIQNLSSDNPELMEAMPDIIQKFGENLVTQVLSSAVIE